GGLTKTGLGPLALKGSANNTYSGTTTVSDGTLLLNKSSGINAISGDLVINGTVRLLQTDQIPDSAALTVNSTAVFHLNSILETICSLAGSPGGSVLLGSSGLLTGGNNSSTTFAGIMSGSGGLTKLGTGVMTLTGNNIYNGVTFVQTGTLLVDGSQPASSVF